jgi:rare lipoprotein A
MAVSRKPASRLGAFWVALAMLTSLASCATAPAESPRQAAAASYPAASAVPPVPAPGEASPVSLPATQPPVAQVPVLPPAPSSAQNVGAAPTPSPVIDRGLASWYGRPFHGRRTASGERYDMHELTAAHRTLPFGTRLRVRSVHTGREVVVRINDRGPFKRTRIIDLSQAAFAALGHRGRGVTQVELLPE